MHNTIRFTPSLTTSSEGINSTLYKVLKLQHQPSQIQLQQAYFCLQQFKLFSKTQMCDIIIYYCVSVRNVSCLLASMLRNWIWPSHTRVEFTSLLSTQHMATLLHRKWIRQQHWFKNFTFLVTIKFFDTNTLPHKQFIIVFKELD